MRNRKLTCCGLLWYDKKIVQSKHIRLVSMDITCIFITVIPSRLCSTAEVNPAKWHIFSNPPQWLLVCRTSESLSSNWAAMTLEMTRSQTSHRIRCTVVERGPCTSPVWLRATSTTWRSLPVWEESMAHQGQWTSLSDIHRIRMGTFSSRLPDYSNSIVFIGQVNLAIRKIIVPVV